MLYYSLLKVGEVRVAVVNRRPYKFYICRSKFYNYWKRIWKIKSHTCMHWYSIKELLILVCNSLISDICTCIFNIFRSLSISVLTFVWNITKTKLKLKYFNCEKLEVRFLIPGYVFLLNINFILIRYLRVILIAYKKYEKNKSCRFN